MASEAVDRACASHREWSERWWFRAVHHLMGTAMLEVIVRLVVARVPAQLYLVALADRGSNCPARDAGGRIPMVTINKTESLSPQGAGVTAMSRH
jgi:hypothetical protein